MSIERSKFKITIVTTMQLSTNPRLLKEAEALSNAGYNVLVLYQHTSIWGEKFDNELIKNKKWKAIKIGGDYNNSLFSLFNYSRLRFKLFKLIHQVIDFDFPLNLYHNGRSLIEMWNFILNDSRSDLYIGHTYPTLPLVVEAAKIKKSFSGFDAEDYHRFEVNNKLDNLSKNIIRIEDKYIPQLNYFSASSDLISEAYNNKYNISPLLLYNVFNKSKIYNSNHSDELKLVWFSQTLGFNRGLDLAIKSLSFLIECKISITIISNSSNTDRESFKQLFQAYANINNHFLNFINPIHPDKLIEYLTNFDIGLALEPGFSINNDYALSNKLFTYINAGLTVIATRTKSQSKFIETYPEIGKLVEYGNYEQMANILREYYLNKDILSKHKKNAFEIHVNRFNWEIESQKLVEVIDQLFLNEND